MFEDIYLIYNNSSMEHTLNLQPDKNRTCDFPFSGYKTLTVRNSSVIIFDIFLVNVNNGNQISKSLVPGFTMLLSAEEYNFVYIVYPEIDKAFSIKLLFN